MNNVYEPVFPFDYLFEFSGIEKVDGFLRVNNVTCELVVVVIFADPWAGENV
jgi:hypothetical protein